MVNYLYVTGKYLLLPLNEAWLTKHDPSRHPQTFQALPLEVLHNPQWNHILTWNALMALTQCVTCSPCDPVDNKIEHFYQSIIISLVTIKHTNIAT